MLKKLMAFVAAIMLAGGIFLTAQAVSAHRTPLPRVTAPLTVTPAAGRTTTRTQAAGTPNPAAQCREGHADDRGRGSDDRSREDCHHMRTVVPSPSVLTHGDDSPGLDEYGGNRTGTDDHGTDDHRGNRTGTDDRGTDDHGGNRTGTDDRGPDDDGGSGHGADDGGRH
ncbi:MAG: hypothetical protein QOI06_3013 [Nocardioidaceae bacterium]|jgi:hypothetical protein|nr:hypothetical protein [Nocardioidaceae bacterium]